MTGLYLAMGFLMLIVAEIMVSWFVFMNWTSGGRPPSKQKQEVMTILLALLLTMLFIGATV